ncbi:hypothetical protein COU23_01880 [Candidatus Kuenenbacteria bacterium CG10_big_fil_rev_8_21_14_0_10_36_11]|uniref:Gcp-like domain-containing protein n=1 Tax=Candidatus Kuenenbacteria bacterium CG10_big_fil_rev_8_21_14_0_10_36_11 TaxID=1974618 RepID=A0A2M6WAL2_9BACT|nr:MAG: hypothetical protein COU23_01880 [Candidatus Kuenenbacteria bacterium CG10_big_fil_rev_8_21_14_0_10_36_11]
MYLFINTSNNKFISLALADAKGKILVYKKIKAEYQQAEKLLTAIEKIIVKYQQEIKKKKFIRREQKFLFPAGFWSQILGIIVVQGPGGFTSLRIGIATANALAWALQIPIVGVEWKKDVMELQDKQLISIGLNKIKKSKKFKQILPKYGSEPNITMKK